MAKITPLLLAGGTGTRLWPASRAEFPKQFAPLPGLAGASGGPGLSLFAQTALRFSGAGFAPPLVVTQEPFRFLAAEALAALRLPPQALLIEPEGRNSAPALLAGVLLAAESAPEALILASPTDHLIPDGDALAATVQAALPAAEAGQIVTFGIQPSRAETAYGWLRPAPGTGFPRPLAAFTEKPPAAQAEAFWTAGGHFWNAGLFLFRADVMRAAAARYAPELLVGVEAALRARRRDLGFLRLPGPAWAALPALSIDHALMEKADNLAVMPFDGAWADLGDWQAFYAMAGKDAAGNATFGAATALGCEGTLLLSSPEGPELVGIDLTGLAVVALPDAVLVAPRDAAQKVKAAAEALRDKGRPSARAFPTSHRPWGRFDILAAGDRFQVKRIEVRQGAALSLQSHLHRAEHWVVVQGTAKVRIGAKTRLISENESIYIPIGCKHRLENPGHVPLVLIEVQTGRYLGEDDIQRFDDLYARLPLVGGEKSSSEDFSENFSEEKFCKILK